MSKAPAQGSSKQKRGKRKAKELDFGVIRNKVAEDEMAFGASAKRSVCPFYMCLEFTLNYAVY
jgi:hypothetical protein